MEVVADFVVEVVADFVVVVEIVGDSLVLEPPDGIVVVVVLFLLTPPFLNVSSFNISELFLNHVIYESI